MDSNSPRLQGWLDDIAQGVKGPVDEEGNETYVVEPDPQKAFELVVSLLEFHVPKLARTELTGEDGAPIPVKAVVEFVNADQSAISREAPPTLPAAPIQGATGWESVDEVMEYRESPTDSGLAETD